MSNFHLSARDITIDGSVLRAQCQKCDGSWNWTELDLNTVLSNEDGVLQWLPDGGFANSCENLTLSDDGTTLTCQAYCANGEMTTAQINLAEQIGNEDGTLCTGAGGACPSTSSPPPQDFGVVQRACQSEALMLHNTLRAKHGVPPLTLDDHMSSKAQAYADYLTTSGKFEHSSDREGMGENLYAGWTSNAETDGRLGREATQLWYDEVKDYDYGQPGFAMNTGHFTQVVWKGTSKLGLGVSFSQGDGRVVIVGRYNPPGNVTGDFPNNVPPPL